MGSLQAYKAQNFQSSFHFLQTRQKTLDNIFFLSYRVWLSLNTVKENLFQAPFFFLQFFQVLVLVTTEPKVVQMG